MNTPLPREERLAVYRRILKRFLHRLAQGSPRIHLPGQPILRKPVPGMFFHLTPELFLQEEGSTGFVCPSDQFRLKKHELAIMPRGVPHGEKAFHGKKPFRGLVISFHGNQLSLIVSKKFPSSELPSVDFMDRLEGSEVSTALRYLDDAAAIPSGSPTVRQQREALVYTCLASLQDLLLAPRLENISETAPHPKVTQCRELIRAYLNNPDLSATDLSREVGCTADHLSRCFRKEMGMSLFDYLRQQRLGRARNLLQDPDLNISEIAWACGFNSLNYFVRSFRQTLGRSPGKYRRGLVSGLSTFAEEGSAPWPAQTAVKIRSKTSSGRSAFKTGRPSTT